MFLVVTFVNYQKINVYTPSECKATTPFAVIHSNVWGPTLIETPNGARYFVTFNAFKELHILIKTEFRINIHTLQSDNGGEYVSLEMGNYCKTNLIRHQTSCARTPQ